jgi:hypothetical protein
MNLKLNIGLPFVTVTVNFRGRNMILEKVLLDTGSARTFFRMDAMGAIGVYPESDDIVNCIQGIGVIEYVYTKKIDSITFDIITMNNFQVEIGNMDSKYDIEGIIGFDFNQAAGLVIDSRELTVESRN